MGLKSTPERYGTVAITLHWVTAAAILAMFTLGIAADNAQADAARRTLLVPHIGLGICVLLLTLFRICWWAFADRKPQHPPGMPAMQLRIATLVHALVYGFIIALAATGIVTNIAGGVIPAIVTGAPIPTLDALGPRRVHGVLAYAFMGLLAIHIAAALYHQLVRRDRLLARMGIGALPGRPES